MVYASLEETIVALNSAESALESSLNDIQDRIAQGYVKEMRGAEVAKVLKSFDTIESILNQLNKTRVRFGKVRQDFRSAAGS
jgi:hypothetical protein